VRVLIVPDKFKGTRSAPEVARALAAGVRRARADADVEILPLADGGDGTVDALVTGVGGRIERVAVTGPLGEPVDAPLGWLDDGRAVIEMAAASGLALVPSRGRAPLRATSRGTGELIARALEHRKAGAAVIVGLGGSASTDGGTGAASALGWRFLDESGRELGPGGGELRRLATIDGSGVSAGLAAGGVVGASDVDNPLLGPRGAAQTFAPQKGASAHEVGVLEEGLTALARCIERDLGVVVAEEWGAGACGGIGAGLIAFCGARLEPGFALVAGVLGLEDAISRADLVITGEGRLDDQSLGGKTPVGVARLARKGGVPCIAIAGEVDVDEESLRREGIARALSLVRAVGSERAVSDVDAALEEVIAGALGNEVPAAGRARPDRRDERGRARPDRRDERGRPGPDRRDETRDTR
jgi:glycerate kinase